MEHGVVVLHFAKVNYLYKAQIKSSSSKKAIAMTKLSCDISYTLLN